VVAAATGGGEGGKSAGTWRETSSGSFAKWTLYTDGSLIHGMLCYFGGEAPKEL